MDILKTLYCFDPHQTLLLPCMLPEPGRASFQITISSPSVASNYAMFYSIEFKVHKYPETELCMLMIASQCQLAITSGILGE